MLFPDVIARRLGITTYNHIRMNATIRVLTILINNNIKLPVVVFLNSIPFLIRYLYKFCFFNFC